MAAQNKHRLMVSTPIDIDHLMVRIGTALTYIADKDHVLVRHGQ